MRITSKGLRDLFFLLIGTAILFHEIWQRPSPSPLGIFAAFFLFGLIPAFRADEGSTLGPLALLVRLLSQREGSQAAPVSRATLAEQEAKVELAEQVARDRAAVRAALVERAGPEAAEKIDVEKRSRPESDE